MSKETILERIHELESVITYDTLQREDEKHFKAGERICINQERGSLYEQLNETNLNPRQYKVSDFIENRIQFVLNKIENGN